ncbi:MAG TPA: DUF6542 domain-containing protein [Mycobacteriales bacterium]|nr:DUF6542 domain-containing protein [Mycobacteriales bacterium]
MTLVDTRRPSTANRPSGPTRPASTAAPATGTLVHAAHARRTFALPGSIGIALGAGIVGIVIGLARGDVTTRVVPLAYVAGCIGASLACRRADLRRLLVALPLVWFVLAVGASVADVIRLGTPMGITSLGVPAGELAVLDAPYLWLGVAVAFLIAAARRGVARS